MNVSTVCGIHKYRHMYIYTYNVCTRGVWVREREGREGRGKGKGGERGGEERGEGRGVSCAHSHLARQAGRRGPEGSHDAALLQ